MTNCWLLWLTVYTTVSLVHHVTSQGKLQEIIRSGFSWQQVFILFIYLFKNSTQYKQYKIEDTIKAVEF